MIIIHGDHFEITPTLTPEGSSYIYMQMHIQTHMQVLRLGRQVASAMAYLHESGVIHRDLKAANILIGDQVCHATGLAVVSGKGCITRFGACQRCGRLQHPREIGLSSGD